jgi:hypothetical protein
VKADAQTESAVMSALKRFLSAYEKRDWEGMSSLLIADRDVSLYATVADGKRIGREEIKHHIERDWSHSQSSALMLDWYAVSAAGPVAWVAADGALQANVGGKAVTGRVRLTTVLEQRSGKWLLAHLHLSVPTGEQPSGGSSTPS